MSIPYDLFHDDQPATQQTGASTMAADLSEEISSVDCAEVIEQCEDVDQRDGIPFTLTSESAGARYSNERIIDESFAWFRSRGFPYADMPRFEMMQQVNRLSLTPDEALRNTNEAYRVADTFHPHRFHATVDGMTSPLECFHDDVKFRHALKMRNEQGKIPATYFTEIGFSRGSQQCSQFRPGFACLLYRRFCKPGYVVLDTSTGYGGRLVGYVASLLRGRYIGIDPNTLTHKGNLSLALALDVTDEVELYNVPAEDLDPQLVAGRCNFSFTSPPYFSKEHYSDEPTQAWRRYGHSFDSWVEGFLRPMLALTYSALKPGSYAALNIEDVTIKSRRYPLVAESVSAAVSVGFKHVGNELFEMQARLGANQDDAVATERVLIFSR